MQSLFTQVFEVFVLHRKRWHLTKRTGIFIKSLCSLTGWHIADIIAAKSPGQAYVI